jgi:hypothetical protein
MDGFSSSTKMPRKKRPGQDDAYASTEDRWKEPD